MAATRAEISSGVKGRAQISRESWLYMDSRFRSVRWGPTLRDWVRTPQWGARTVTKMAEVITNASTRSAPQAVMISVTVDSTRCTSPPEHRMPSPISMAADKSRSASSRWNSM